MAAVNEQLEETTEAKSAGESAPMVLNTRPLFKLMVDKKASDLFFTTYAPVMIKIDGKIMPVNQVELSPKMVRQAAMEHMNEQQLEQFTKDLEIDFAISEAGLGRFRVNVFHQRGNVAMVLRFISPELPQLDALGMPDILKDMIMLRRGLILMVGATGAGKTTTLASMIDYRNENASGHILTVEEPIEFTYTNKKSLVNQRDIGSDTESLQLALKNALRGKPSLATYLRAHLDRIGEGDYCAVLAYVAMNDLHERPLQAMRRRVRDAKGVATCLQFGPRFLHSTGQAHKGGPDSGVFLQITCDDEHDLEIPGKKYTFGVVKAAEARGDFEVLAERGRRVLRVHLGGHVATGLTALREAVRQAIA